MYFIFYEKVVESVKCIIIFSAGYLF